MALLRLDETLQVFGTGREQIGPVSYVDRWRVNNLILNYDGTQWMYPQIAVYRNYVEPRNLIMKSENVDHVNKTVIVDFELTAGENVVLDVVGDDPGGLVSLHILGERIVAMAGYNQQVNIYQGF